MISPSFPIIRQNLQSFAKKWKETSRENADAKLFWARFYECFGVSPEEATIYEKSVDKLDGTRGFIDSFIPGKLIVEHKSRGKNLDSAFTQASDYFLALSSGERPRYIIVSDFARFRLYDLKNDTQVECTLGSLYKHTGWFRFLLDDGDVDDIVEESPINRQAAYVVSKLHEALLQANFRGRDLEVFLTRLLFCFFADDTGIFGQDGIFRRYVEATRDDGCDTGQALAVLFDVLDTPDNERSSNLHDRLSAFAYINGSLFSERTRIPSFDKGMRALLVKSAELDWSGISPAIFGAMFQGVLEVHTPDEKRQASRRELGAHYTSERNILRVINPLFMNDLREEFEKAGKNKIRLQTLYDKLPTLKFLDPACGCGNFLVIAYRELRRLENDVIATLFGGFQQGRGLLDVSTLCRVRVNQFYGIEIDDAAAHIARVALWITDHQMNLESAERFGNTRPTVPLVDTPHIHKENALRVDWSVTLPPEQCSYVMGNPPFIGAKNLNDQQRDDARLVFVDVNNGGLLDYVAAWYIKALDYIKVNPLIDVGFVSTNSLTQGEQVSVLWSVMLQNGAHIRFAHRTFQWSNEGKGNAAVHCVIIGFGLRKPSTFTIHDYGGNIKADIGQEIHAKRINPYLIDAPDYLLMNRRRPICAVPIIGIGNKPIDGGHYLFTDDEKNAFVTTEPKSEPLFRRWYGADEFINNRPRWCLWLGDLKPNELRAMSECMKRVQAVRQYRLNSNSVPTQKLADKPTRFHVEFMPTESFLVIPSVSSEQREFVPVGFLSPDALASNLVLTIKDATLYDFAMLNSTMHNAWMRVVGGRLKSDYRYSASIVYNNFPWPEPTAAQCEAMVITAQGILDARALYPHSTMADLYDRRTMPIELRKAHAANDKAVDAAYGYRGEKSDVARAVFLFELYGRLTSILLPEKPRSSTKKARLMSDGEHLTAKT